MGVDNNSKRQEELETVNREHSERKERKEMTKKEMTVALANLTPDDRCQEENSNTVARHSTKCSTTQYKV